MIAYFLIAVLATLPIQLASHFENKVDSQHTRIITVCLYAISAVVFCFFAGARDINVGWDTHAYGINSFQFATTTGFITFFFDSSYASWPPLMKLTCWISANLSHSFFWYLFALELMTVVPVLVSCRLVLKNNAWAGVLIFGILLYPASLNLMRQLISMSWVLLSYVFMRTRRPLFFVLFIAIAALFHDSALIALAAYPIWLIGQWDKGSMGIKVAILAGVAGLLIPLFVPIMNAILPPDNHYVAYITGGYLEKKGGYGIASGIAIMCVSLSLLYYYLLGKDNSEKTRNPELSGLTYLVFFGSAAFFLCTISDYLFRISLYFLIFAVLLVPMALERLQPTCSKIIFGTTSLAMISGFSVCYYAITLSHSVVPYVFGL